MSRRTEKLEALFEAALALESAAQRQAYLDRACLELDLRREVESLLAAHGNPDSLLVTQRESTEPGTGTNAPITEQPGDRIGRYKLLEKIGEGGCGVVYVAEQEEPVRRRVALKVIKLGMDTKSVIARFEAERQALAMMDHPHIAKVLDAGATETGRPYFVMELVRGIRITDYCDQANLPMAQRLELFTQVCSAVQHAHQKGIIHRDLKPLNILVTLHDGVPMPKVIDFGIAKAIEGRLTDKTVYTELHQFIGTPAYMSPEQAEMSALDIDTRCDIYSLGVLLYELLTGRPPFDAKELMQAGFDEMRRKIREEEPQRPSTRLSTLLRADLTTVANQRQAEAPKLITLLRGDLDWIVMKCLEKDRTRRYETATGLAADIQRHLSNEAVIARPPSAAYRFGKFARRNKLTLTAAAAVFLTLALGLGLSAWQAVRAMRAERAQTSLRREAEQARSIEVTLRQKAEASEKKATDEATIATAVSDFLRSDLLQTAGSGYQTDYLRIPANPNLTMVEALDRAAESVKDRFRAQPLVEAAIRYTIGVTYNDLGEHWAAIPQLERAWELRRHRLGLGGLSDSGIIAFNFSDTDPATGTPRVRVMRARNGLLTTLMETHPDEDSIFLGLPEINNMGEVAFVARQPAGDFTLAQLYVGLEAPLTLVDEAGPGPGEGMTGPALNDLGSISYWRYSEQADEQGLYLWRQGAGGRVFDPLTQGLPIEVSLLGATHGVLLNDGDSIAFNTFRRDCVTFPDGTPGLCTVNRSRLLRLDGGVITTIAERTAELSPGVPMGLNNRGDVAFLGVGSDRRSTLYVGDGGSIRRVIGQGDMLWEKTVATVGAPAILNVSLNARGQLAFVVRFSDGSRVLVRATPWSTN